MATWNSGTALNTTLEIEVTNLTVITITIAKTGTISGGAITFEEDDGSGWGATDAISSGSVQQSVVDLSALVGTEYWFKNIERCKFRMRLSTVITGAGSVDVSLSLTTTSGVNLQTGTTYTAVKLDHDKLIAMSSSSAKTLILPSPPPFSTWRIFVENIGTGLLTVDRNGLTIDGVGSDLTLDLDQGVYITTDGTNYYTERGMGAGTSGGGLNGVNEQSGDYTADGTDDGKLISMTKATAKTLTLPSTPPTATWSIFAQNLGTGTLTIDRNGLNIDNTASNLTLIQKEGVFISTDGSNYFTERGFPPVMIGDAGSGGKEGLVPTPATGDAANYLRGDATWVAQPYIVIIPIGGQPPDTATLLIIIFDRSVTFAGNFSGSRGKDLTDPSATYTLTVNKNGSSCGTIVISTSGVFTFTTTSGNPVTFAAGDYMTISTPAQDSTLADVTVTLVGTR